MLPAGSGRDVSPGPDVKGGFVRGVLVVGGRLPAFDPWCPATCSFPELTPERAAAHDVVVLMPTDGDSDEACERVFGWKRGGRLGDTKLMLGTYRGRHLWSPENDRVVDRWAVHARSEALVLESDNLAFVPFCQGLAPPAGPPTGDDGYVFLGGRKWRDFPLGLAAMQRSGLPGKVISDLVPDGDYPGLEVRRERIPKDEYFAVLGRARIVILPLLPVPISHGHVEVVGAITAGRPVVVTACASCDDYVEHGVNGLLVQENSVEAWLEAIAEADRRAEEFAEAARAMAPRYYSHRYGGYVRRMVEEPEAARVRPDLERAKPYAPKAAWAHLRQENYLRRLKADHRERLDRARDLLRQRRYEDALGEVADCLDGPLQDAARKVAEAARVGRDGRAAQNAAARTEGVCIVKTLDEIGIEAGTDKSSKKHNYLVSYERALGNMRLNKIKLMEIGVFNGSSLRMWREFFQNGQIIGVDNKPHTLKHAGDRIEVVFGDQSDEDCLRAIAKDHGPFDVIVDDGSHIWSHQILTLQTLLPAVNSGGIYIIEDMHTSFGSYVDDYGQGAAETAVDYVLRIAKRLVGDRFFDPQDCDEFTRSAPSLITQIAFVGRAAIFWRR